MSCIKIIDTKFQWDEVIKNFRDIDSYYSFEYGKIFAEIEKGKILAAYFEKNTTRIFYPFIRRQVPYGEKGMYDIVTPYGYGGPLIEGGYTPLREFYIQFGNYCKQNRIITETIRFHPLYGNHELCKEILDVQYIRQPTSVNLTVPLEEIRNNYSTMNKRNIKKAKRNSLSCFVAEKSLENIQKFNKMYKETMDRNNAGSYYYFNESYFMDQMKDTSISKTFLLFTKYNDQIIAGVMVIIGQSYSHYHLGASDTSFLELKPNNLLFDYMIEFCKSMGSLELHLGGGYQENDGLFKFKTSFSNNNNYQYYIGKKIHNTAIYKTIMEKLMEDNEIDKDYFPAYRGRIKRKVVII
ncbi:MAG: GNAT family N-acetyltransferase [Bacillus sp. (in: Bacteria)]|nr:GNAT family N-acetyltransferase [Bacillus sp. (in: firmicutes)]